MIRIPIWLLFALLLAGVSVAGEQWREQESGTRARFRGVSVVSSQVAWASGTGGTFARTIDAGRRWRSAVVPGAEPLDFRDVEGVDASTAYPLSIGNAKVWFGTGGGEQARVFRSNDRGRTWEVAAAPITAGSSSAGIFSIAFLDARRGVVVGGDYKKENEPSDNVAVTRDGGKTWSLAKRSLPGYRSGVSVVRTAGGSLLIAVGPSGADISKDEGVHWESLGTLGFHAIGLAGSGVAGWAVGENGRIAKYLSRASSKNAR